MDDLIRAALSRWRKKASELTANNVFKASIRIPLICTQPMVRVYASAYNQSKLTKQMIAQCASDDRAFDGIQTTMYQMVARTAGEIRASMGALLVSEGDATEDKFAGGWALLPVVFVEQGRCLIVTLMLLQICEFDRRMMENADGFPGQLLLIIGKPREQVCANRKRVCRRLLDTPDAELSKPHSDVSLKVKHAYESDLAHASATGLCTLPLWSLVTTLNLVYPFDTQGRELALD